MPMTFEGNANTNNGTANTTQPATIPSNLEGDIIMVSGGFTQAGLAPSGTVTPPAGGAWTVVHNTNMVDNNNTSDVRVFSAWRVAPPGGLSSPQTFTCSTSMGCQFQSVVIRGVDTADPIADASALNIVASATGVSPVVNVPEDNGLVYVCEINDDIISNSGMHPAGYINLSATENASPTDGVGMGSAGLENVASGTSGPANWSLSASGDSAAFSISFNDIDLGATPELVGTHSQGQSTTATIAHSVVIPTNIDGDLVAVMIGFTTGGTVTPVDSVIPAGWARIFNEAVTAASGVRCCLFWIRAGVGGISSPQNFDSAAVAGYAYISTVWRNTDPLAPIHQSAIINNGDSTNGGLSNPLSPSVTTTENETRILRLNWSDDGALQATTHPAGHTAQGFIENTLPGNGLGVGLAHVAQPSAGASGTAQWTPTTGTSEENGCATVALLGVQGPTITNALDEDFQDTDCFGVDGSAFGDPGGSSKVECGDQAPYPPATLVLQNELGDRTDTKINMGFVQGALLPGLNYLFVTEETGITGAGFPINIYVQHEIDDTDKENQNFEAGDSVTVFGTDFGTNQDTGEEIQIGDGTTWVDQTVSTWADTEILFTSADITGLTPGPLFLRILRQDSAKGDLGVPRNSPRFAVNVEGSAEWLPANSANFVDADPTTAQLTSPGGTFIAGEIKETDSVASPLTIPADGYTEHEFNMQAQTGAAATQYEMRLAARDQKGERLENYVVTPKVTTA